MTRNEAQVAEALRLIHEERLTVPLAAERVGASERSLYRWRQAARGRRRTAAALQRRATYHRLSTADAASAVLLSVRLIATVDTPSRLRGLAIVVADDSSE